MPLEQPQDPGQDHYPILQKRTLRPREVIQFFIVADAERLESSSSDSRSSTVCLTTLCMSTWQSEEKRQSQWGWVWAISGRTV